MDSFSREFLQFGIATFARVYDSSMGKGRFQPFLEEHGHESRQKILLLGFYSVTSGNVHLYYNTRVHWRDTIGSIISHLTFQRKFIGNVSPCRQHLQTDTQAKIHLSVSSISFRSRGCSGSFETSSRSNTRAISVI